MAIRMICFDMDGTLLTYDKRITEKTLAVLRKAGQMGYLLVPATGRLPRALDSRLQEIPGVRYAICINGALVYDYQEDKVMYRAEIPFETARRAFAYLDTLPVVYDCFGDDVRYCGEEHANRMKDFIPDPHIYSMVRKTMVCVPQLGSFLDKRGGTLQKIQAYFQDNQLRLDTVSALREKFPELSVTTSLPYNCELNDSHANKGEALEHLCAHLGMDLGETMAFGDGANDLTMIQRAGLGIVMENGLQELKDHADAFTESNDRDGVARAICRYCGIDWDSV